VGPSVDLDHGTLFADDDADFSEDGRVAPVLELNMPGKPSWPPPLDGLTRCAERCLERSGIPLGSRRARVARALARYHQLLCEERSCSYFVVSLHAFIDAAESLASEMRRAPSVDVFQLTERYLARNYPADNAPLISALARL
jgi:hypothetical protein